MKTQIHFLVIGILAVLLAIPVSAQKKLILTRIGSKNKITFVAGDLIRLKVKGAENYVGGLIVGLRDTAIHFHNFDIDLDSISEIDVRNKVVGGFNIGQYGPPIILAGVIFMGADLTNQERLASKSAVISGLMVTTGFTMILIRKKRFKIKGRNKITIID